VIIYEYQTSENPSVIPSLTMAPPFYACISIDLDKVSKTRTEGAARAEGEEIERSLRTERARSDLQHSFGLGNTVLSLENVFYLGLKD
jgi:hypothetical protein